MRANFTEAEADREYQRDGNEKLSIRVQRLVYEIKNKSHGV